MKNLNETAVTADEVFKNGKLIETEWYRNQFPGKYTMKYKGKFYTVYIENKFGDLRLEKGADTAALQNAGIEI